MKWIYYIFRLFKCEHNDITVKEFKRTITRNYTKEETIIYVNRCQHCGRLTKTEI